MAFVGTVAAVHARKLGREVATEKTVIASREKAASERAIAEANARAAEAKRDAANAELETTKLRATIADRDLSPEQQDR